MGGLLKRSTINKCLFQMKISDDILTSFPRPRDGLILVYLIAKAVDGTVRTTYQQIANDTDYSVKQVRSSLATLISKGQIEGRLRAHLGCDITICKTISSENEKTPKGRLRAERGQKQNKTEDRKQAFYDSIRPFVGKYPNKMLREFFDYWSEPNPSKTKMRFELEKTWEINRRLSTWANRENPKGGMSTGVKLDTKEMNYDKSNDWG